MEDKLKFILQLTNDWLKFSESKNAVLTTFITVSTFGAIRIMHNQNFSQLLSYYIIHYILFCSIGLILVLFSFAPQTKKSWLSNKGHPSMADNLLFFGHIEKYEAHGLIGSIEKKYLLKSANHNAEIDIAEQIIENSKIAMRKYRYFSISFFFVLCGILSLPVAVFLYWILNPNEN